jgi:lactoylglutathione lyase
MPGDNIMIKAKAGTIALGHIGLTVSDLDVSEGFYQEVLGLRVVDESLQFPSRYASMARDGKIVLTLWEQSGRRIKKCQPALHHLAFEAESVEEVNRTKGLLDNLGAHWTEGARIYPKGSRTAAIHFEDPDGTRIELYSSDQFAASDGREMSELELRARAHAGLFSTISSAKLNNLKTAQADLGRPQIRLNNWSSEL